MIWTDRQDFKFSEMDQYGIMHTILTISTIQSACVNH